MIPVRAALLLGLLPAIAMAQASGRPDDPRIKVIPEPKQVQFGEGRLRLKPDTKVVAGEDIRRGSPACVEVLLQEVKERCGLTLQAADSAQDNAIVLSLVTPDARVEKIGEEGYVLDVSPSRAAVTANAPAGVFYGVQTLIQLLEKGAEGASLPCLEIRDWPGLRYRGIQDDVSRGPVPTIDYLKREVRTIASYKMNLFCLYIEHVFQFEKHPEIAPEGGGYTAGQIRELVAYAKQYHVEVLPQMQCFGHQYHVLKHPEYADIREMPQGGSVFCPLVERTYAVLGDFLSEYAPCFESRFFHAGCDETVELGMGRSKDKAKEIGIAGLYLQHIKRLDDMIKKHGKRMMFWGDIALHHREMIPQLPKDIVVMNWTYGAAQSFDDRLQAFQDAGLDQFVCPGVDCWSRMFPNYGNAVVNIRNFVRDGYKHGALGMLNTTWDDDGENLFGYNWYGAVFSSECAWAPETVEVGRFDRKFACQFYGPNTDDVVRATWLLADTNAIPAVAMNPDGLFREDPFTGPSPLMGRGFAGRMAKIGPMAAEALALLAKAAPGVARDRDNLDYLVFAGKRIAFTGRKFVACDEVAKAYRDAFDLQFRNKAEAAAMVSRGRDALNGLADEVPPLREEYKRLWLQENRPYYLDKITPRYDVIENCLRGKARQLGEALAKLEKGEPIPEPEQIGLAERRLPRREIRVAKADVDAAADWWNRDWRYRVPLRLDAAKADSEDAPVEVPIHFGDFLKEKPDISSIRLVEITKGLVAPREVLCQFVPGKGFDAEKRPAGAVVWIAQGKLAAGSSRLYHLYFDTIANGPKAPVGCDDPVKTYDAEGGKWIENSRIKVKLGEKSGVLFVWQVKALNALDVTQPGESGWAGFGDMGREYRDLPFKLDCAAAGPVLVRYTATSPDGVVKTYDFYRGAGWCDAYAGIRTRFYWDYDNADNMSSASKTPGKWLTASGESGDVGAPGRPSEGGPGTTTWAVKWRPDKLAIGLVAPDERACFRVGPGGGMGGVGIEGYADASHFVTFADVCDDPAAAMGSLEAALAIRNAPSTVIGAVERPKEGGR